MEHTIDAQGKNLGRVASEAAHLLMGKDTTSFQKNVVADVTVKIANADKLAISPEKASKKVYTHYTGHPGGLRKRTLEEVVEKKGVGEVLRMAVYGMLPGNRLRAKRMKNLIIEE
ncbi:MAG: 50S ribosomal protein L13 [Candidatus Pacebacteria bacterium]|nr:50S ribosomal protein L13 [Candidatus Paceibacterota bacterium]